MFMKFLFVGDQVVYVSCNNIYVEEVSFGKIKVFIVDGSILLINGIFDWVYEEEFSC